MLLLLCHLDHAPGCALPLKPCCCSRVPSHRRGKREAVFKEVCEKIAAMFGEGLTQHRSVPELAGLIVCMAGCCLLRHVWRMAPLRALPCAVGSMRHVHEATPLSCTHVRAWTLPLPLLHAGDKYVVRMVEDPEAALDEPIRSSGGDSGAAPEPRVQFEILPASSAQPVATKGWQRVAAGVLLLLTLGSTLQFGLAANIGLLPKVWRTLCMLWSGRAAAFVAWGGAAAAALQPQTRF